jgi:hypothetical protein
MHLPSLVYVDHVLFDSSVLAAVVFATLGQFSGDLGELKARLEEELK